MEMIFVCQYLGTVGPNDLRLHGQESKTTSDFAAASVAWLDGKDDVKKSMVAPGQSLTLLYHASPLPASCLHSSQDFLTQRVIVSFLGPSFAQMKRAFTIGAIVATFALPSVTQDITSLPQCAQQPILEAISASDCPLTDIACICANEGFVNGLVQLIPTVCTPSEVELVIEFAETLCSAYDVDIDLPISSAPSGTSSILPTTTRNSITASPTATSTGSESAVATTYTAPSSGITSSGLSESAETAPSTISTNSIGTGVTESSTRASESSGPAQQTENAAATNVIASTGFLGAMAMGILAMI
ncbi:uncharacterized protein A1O9_09853 [Exophiala aquamarina CBS 119918]|uniref:CFEM domain-containing protein n=1 Tax=Exophiala aquamarina CBS 119918 TaxID=1182545 RepID=A0A072P459_9EURO|nr:uncharacterized protein A1O9_09853 [Exophiala aquamarina CBS 119918]KEF54058.1 hypothetical protein A1O9_09853 [Exophiala aquamarina CBS 119918]